ncbi:methyltransferase [Neptuniibacter sp. CAU 1671]|uniref:methyltransferase n=1 Tax=Neptuniibacter sp. CAU 1671 TaxID=3032593 RepID=UPI0023DB60DF|nr:methyltransferase [Neptuniibacter sp. CAU 1671]MDF2181867.1 methyltransferase [Neptuniibacter sp. CAU 1671]
MQTLSVPQGSFQLSLFPRRPKETLRAWDAADEYLLNHLSELGLLADSPRILIINDAFGSLMTALHVWQPTLISDSWLAHEATRANFIDNGLDQDSVHLNTSLDWPTVSQDLIILKIPKSLAMLEDQLIRIRALMGPDTRLIAGGMVKQIHSSTLQLFEKHIGPTQTSLAQKKARLILPELDPTLPAHSSPYPSRYTLEGSDLELMNHAGVFSRDSLDIGTRFMLEHLPVNPRFKQILDLGCGNGVLGIVSAQQHPEAELTFVDESFMATASARDNFQRAFENQRQARFINTDCLSGIAPESTDLILNNPPFHQQNVVGDFIARQMFKQARQVLRSRGELWVVGNRHLGYHLMLKKLFGQCQTVAANRKFVILRAIKR